MPYVMTKSPVDSMAEQPTQAGSSESIAEGARIMGLYGSPTVDVRNDEPAHSVVKGSERPHVGHAISEMASVPVNASS